MSLEDELAVLDLRYAELLRQQQHHRQCANGKSSLNDPVSPCQRPCKENQTQNYNVITVREGSLIARKPHKTQKG